MRILTALLLCVPVVVVAQEPEEQVPAVGWVEIDLNPNDRDHKVRLYFVRDEPEVGNNFRYSAKLYGKSTFLPLSEKNLKSNDNATSPWRAEINKDGSWEYSIQNQSLFNAFFYWPKSFGRQERESSQYGRLPGPIDRVEVQITRNGLDVGPLHVFAPLKGYKHVLTRAPSDKED